jgi:hypothetical protein
MISKIPWKIVSSTGVVLGIIASVISIWTFLKVDRLEKIAEEAKNWTCSIVLEEPKSGIEVFGFAVRIAGKIDLRIAANENQERQKINLTMYQKKIYLVCFVRPISVQTCQWYLQPMPVIYQDGSFDGLAFLSDKDVGKGGIEHQIIVLAVPRHTLAEIFEHKNLPFYFAASNIASVRRTIDEIH